MESRASIRTLVCGSEKSGQKLLFKQAINLVHKPQPENLHEDARKIAIAGVFVFVDLHGWGNHVRILIEFEVRFVRNSTFVFDLFGFMTDLIIRSAG